MSRTGSDTQKKGSINICGMKEKKIPAGRGNNGLRTEECVCLTLPSVPGAWGRETRLKGLPLLDGKYLLDRIILIASDYDVPDRLHFITSRNPDDNILRRCIYYSHFIGWGNTHGEVISLAHSYTASQWWGWDLASGSLAPVYSRAGCPVWQLPATGNVASPK